MSAGEAEAADVVITNPTGLHARPALKLTKLAKTFPALTELSVDEGATWTDAKSVARVMKLKAVLGATLKLRASGEGAAEAVAALADLVRRDFDEGAGGHDAP